MSKKKSTQTNTVAWTAPPTTQAVTDLQSQVNDVDYMTPIRNSYARAQQANSRSYKNPLGAYTTADVRDKSIRSQNADFNQSMGIDMANAAQQNANARFGRQATVAGFTQPQMYGSGGTSTVSDPLGTIMGIGQIAGGIGQAAIG